MRGSKAWKEFMDSGMLWWINRIIHTFGWSIQVVEEEDGTITAAFPIRSTWLGFPNEVNEVKLPAFQAHIRRHSAKCNWCGQEEHTSSCYERKLNRIRKVLDEIDDYAACEDLIREALDGWATYQERKP